MKRNGFTLIELLIVIAILAILAGAGIAQYTAYNKTQQLNAASQIFESVLNTARDRALSQDKRCADTTYDQLVGYDVDVSGNLYSINALCIVGPGSSYASTASIGTKYEWSAISQRPVATNSNISFKQTYSVQFLVQNGGASVYNAFGGALVTPSNQVELDFNGTSPLQYKTFKIDPSGAISVQ